MKKRDNETAKMNERFVNWRNAGDVAAEMIDEKKAERISTEIDSRVQFQVTKKSTRENCDVDPTGPIPVREKSS